MKIKKNLELKLLKTILWIYIVLCIVIAGLNYGYAANASVPMATFISRLWHFYENWIKTLFIIGGSVLSLRIIKQSKRSKMFKQNVFGFTMAALLVHIFLPFVMKNQELYFFTMPLPWTTSPLQLFYEESSLYMSRAPVWGLGGVSAALILYFTWTTIVVLGTLLLGRRWQCSTICLFNGFASEVFAPAFPLVGKKKKISPKGLRIFYTLRVLFFCIALFFTLAWLIFLLTGSTVMDIAALAQIENYKYLSFELLMMMFFWISLSGRGYCYYCPLGTLLGFLSKLSGQKIKTDLSNCIECELCNQSCPMSIDIMKQARAGEPVTVFRCVGCGHCIDSCPTQNLSYSTKFLESLK